jgi:hypothetical protein
MPAGFGLEIPPTAESLVRAAPSANNVHKKATEGEKAETASRTVPK